jgi:hypothetical protein
MENSILRHCIDDIGILEGTVAVTKNRVIADFVNCIRGDLDRIPVKFGTFKLRLKSVDKIEKLENEHYKYSGAVFKIISRK